MNQLLFQSQTCNLNIPIIQDNSIPFNKINSHTLYKLINNPTIYSNYFASLNIIDTRFEYEFNGGHIPNSINIRKINDLINFLNNKKKDNNKPMLLIFHCEYSQYRSIQLINELRRWDRNVVSMESYPLLNFPDILILDGGYNSWFNTYPKYCIGDGYTKMKLIDYKKCEKKIRKCNNNDIIIKKKSNNNKSLLFFNDEIPISKEFDSNILLKKIMQNTL